MQRIVINSPRVTALRSGMSHAVRLGDVVYVSGATPFRGVREIATGDFEAQCHQVMRNVQAVLEDAGASFATAVKCNCALTTMKNFRAFDTIFRSYFTPGNFPARATTESPNLALPEFLLSVDCTALCTGPVNPAAISLG